MRDIGLFVCVYVLALVRFIILMRIITMLIYPLSVRHLHTLSRAEGVIDNSCLVLLLVLRVKIFNPLFKQLVLNL